jgi:hypothetical protein
MVVTYYFPSETTKGKQKNKDSSQNVNHPRDMYRASKDLFIREGRNSTAKFIEMFESTRSKR